MRIVGGSLKGRKFDPPNNLGVRPTTDMAREALFNILQHKIALRSAKVLDIFGGSGAISIECISRGAAEVTTIEKLPKVFKHLNKLKEQLKLSNWQPVLSTAEQWLKKQTPAPRFDLIFMDPPYALATKAQLVQAALPLLLADGLLVLEHPTKEQYSNLACFLEQRTYGQSSFSIFVHAAAAASGV